jgi:D-serine deaminase-like pyridoxal phosphate-dependent protein
VPELIVHKKKCLANIERMVQKVAYYGLSFRPHFKTHQSVEIGNWFYEQGVFRITVSSFKMAAYFSRAGWKDILVAFPFNPREISRLNTLASLQKISILLDNPETLVALKDLEHVVEYYIDVDTGYGRTGIESRDFEAIGRLLDLARDNEKLVFRGFYCHAGHSYKYPFREKQDAIHQKALSDLKGLKDHFVAFQPMVLYGDTPNCSIQEEFPGIDELTPGNFVFYDLTQHHLGSCELEDIAVSMACAVTGKYPDRQQLLLHGGAVHFSKDRLELEGRDIYGQVMGTGVYMDSISQEHGILEHAGELYERTRIGDILQILPVHSCLAANLMRTYRTEEGEWIETLNS